MSLGESPLPWDWWALPTFFWGVCTGPGHRRAVVLGSASRGRSESVGSEVEGSP